MRTLGDHPLLLGELLARAEARDKQRFARAHRRARLLQTWLPLLFPFIGVISFLGLSWLGLFIFRALR